MPAFHLMMTASSVTALCLSVFAVVSDLKTEDEGISENAVVIREPAPVAPVPEQVKQDIEALKQQVAALTTATRAAPSGAADPAELALLKDEFAVLRRQLDSVLAERQKADLNGTEADVISPQELELVSEDQALKYKQRIAAIDAGFQAEPGYTEWSVKTTDLILQTFATEALAQSSDVLAVECRTSLCKVEVHHDNANDFQLFQMQFMLGISDALPTAMFEQDLQDDGSVNSVLYLVREGFDFPVNPE